MMGNGIVCFLLRRLGEKLYYCKEERGWEVDRWSSVCFKCGG